MPQDTYVALLHQGAELAHGVKDRGGIGGLPFQGQRHAGAGAVLPDQGELSTSNGVTSGDPHLTDVPALAVLLTELQAKGVKPLLSGCHKSNQRQISANLSLYLIGKGSHQAGTGFPGAKLSAKSSAKQGAVGAPDPLQGKRQNLETRFSNWVSQWSQGDSNS